MMTVKNISTARAATGPRGRFFSFWSALLLWAVVSRLMAGDLRASEPVPADAPSVELSREGKALLPLVVAPTASDQTRQLARELAAGLQRITGATFSIRDGAEGDAIVVGTDSDFPGILPDELNGDPLTTREAYVIRTRPGRLLLIGKSELAVQNAIWDLLYRFGFRQFFPGPNWEIWPASPSLKIALDTVESPSFYNRRFAISGVGAWKESAKGFDQWKIRNRMVTSMNLKLGHAYGAIVRRNKDYFDQNPEAFALKPDGTRGHKFDPTVESLLEVVADDALRQYQKNPAIDGISVEPSDGGGWRADSPLGSPSNQALTLANHTAKAIQTQFPGKKVCMLAYNRHSAPPDIDVDPNVIVTAQTYAITGGFKIEQIMKGWKARKATLGVSDFLSLWVWNHDIPGSSKASDLTYLSTQIPAYHQWGARYWNSGISPAWAPQGLGYYLASRILWSTGEAERLPELLDDFYSRSFENIAPEMRAYYEKYLLSSGKPLFSEDLIGRMYRHLGAALEKSPSPAVVKRIADLIAHVRTLELLMAYQNQTNKEKRQAAYEELARFAYGIRDREMVSSRSIVHWSHKWDKQITFNEKWKDAAPVTDAELVEMLPGGIARNRLMEFEPVGFSQELVPAGGNPAEENPASSDPIRIVGVNTFYLYADAADHGFDLTVKGATLWPKRGPVRLTLFAEENAVLDEPAAFVEVPADKSTHSVRLSSPFSGLHRLEVSDGGGGTDILWPAGCKAALPMAPNSSVRFYSAFRYDAAFFVPEGTRVVGGFSRSPIGSVKAPNGEIVFDFKTMGKPGYFSVAVPEGQDGKWWWILKAKREKLLLTVPPYLVRSPSEGLVPKEVRIAFEKEGGDAAK